MPLMIRSLLFALITCWAVAVNSAMALDLGGFDDGEFAGLYSQHYLDESNQLTLEQALSNDVDWTLSKESIPAFGYSPATVWLKLELANQGASNEWFLDISYPVLDQVNVYIQYSDRLEIFEMGDKRLFRKRPVNHRDFVVPLILEQGKRATVLVQVSSGTSLQVPIKLWRQKAFYDHQQSSLMFQGIYFGFMLVMILYNLFLYSYIQEIRYVLYVAFVLSFTLFQASISGFGYQFLWPESPGWNDHTLPLFLGCVLLSESIFIRAFLGLKKNAPRVSVFLVGTAMLALTIMVLSLALPYRISIISLIVLALPINIVCLVMGVKQSLQGDRAAQLFSVAWFSTLVGAVFLALNKLGVLERNMITENALQIGTAVEVVLLSFALGEYIAKQRREQRRLKDEAYQYAVTIAKEREEKLKAQDKTITMERVAREAQEKTLLTQKQVNETLETQVQERTSQLQDALQKLEQVNAKLEHISNLDELTGIYNRRYFNRRLEAEFKRAKRNESCTAVIIADVDHFKSVNDTYGHLVGDTCLKAVAYNILNTATRPMDILARYGGEEFIMLLPDTPLEGAEHVAERIRKVVEQTMVKYEDLSLGITISVGVAALTPVHRDQPEQLIAAADAALYAAKEAGRNQVVVAPGNLSGFKSKKC